MPVIYEQRDQYTDFPVGTWKMYLIDGVLMVPSENRGDRYDQPAGIPGVPEKTSHPFLEWQRACGGGCTGQRKGFSYGSGKKVARTGTP